MLGAVAPGTGAYIGTDWADLTESYDQQATRASDD